MKTNKKGLATGLLVIVIFMFVFALMSLLSITLFDEFNGSIQNMDNETISPAVKAKIELLRDKMLWGDKLFAFFFVALLIAYLISSVTITTENPEYLFIFFILILLTSLLCMVFSNTWAFMIEQPNFVVAATELSFTNYILSYYPIFMFLTGILGAGLFYARKKSGNGGGFSSNKGGDLENVFE